MDLAEHYALFVLTLNTDPLLVLRAARATGKTGLVNLHVGIIIAYVMQVKYITQEFRNGMDE